jgi:hypothetical protein
VQMLQSLPEPAVGGNTTAMCVGLLLVCSGTVGATTGLSVVLQLWLDHASDVSGSLLNRQCAAALLQLLQLRHHPALSGLTVAGAVIENPGAAGGGRVTRSKAKQQGGLRYSQVGWL